MRTAVATSNIVLGTAYLGVGFLILLDLKQGWHVFGFSRFGAGLAAVAFTCGAHHFVHGEHVAFRGQDAGRVDLLTVLVGLPFAATWLWLRLEALTGRPGERFIPGTPPWVLALPNLAGVYVTVLVVAGFHVVHRSATFQVALLPHVALVGVYLTIGWLLLRTQFVFHRESGGWSLSGCSFCGIFFTCAVMHAAIVLSGIGGREVVDVHGFLIALLGVPAGIYFLRVVRELVRAEASDWNVEAEEELSARRAA